MELATDDHANFRAEKPNDSFHLFLNF